ncbi:MAG: DUF5050 domain-containing protein [Clostridia bacterium]|nr:DUF5050 domain-containing protein [Clostridia bacterium]
MAAEQLTVQPYRAGMTYHEVFDPYTDYDNRFYSVMNGFNMTETEDAYYFIRSGNPFLYCCDKASGESGVLCGKPECIHDQNGDNSNCSGCISAQIMSLSFYKGKLYYVGLSGDHVSARNLALYRMDPDGTDREKLADLYCDSYSLIFLQTFVHRGWLYAVSTDQDITGGSPETGASVVRWNMETGEFRSLFKFNGFECSTVIPGTFFFGKYLYFVIDGFDDEEGPHHVNIYRFDTEKEELESIYLSKPGEFYNGWYRIWAVSENELYISAFMLDEHENSLFCLREGKLEKAFTIDFSKETFDGANAFFLDGALVMEHINPNGPEKSGIQIRDFAGNILYDGAWSFDFIGGQTDRLCGLKGIYGNSTTIFCPFEATEPTGKEAFYFVKYELENGELSETLLYSDAER